MAHDFEAPLCHAHARVEGNKEYTQLLYIPAQAPFDLWDREHRRGIKLYVRRVFIMDDAEQLMPNYLRFVRGVIDSSDLPLNVSREILQESKDIEAIRAGSVRRVLGMIEDLAENDKGKIRDVLEGIRPRVQGRRRRGSRQPRAHREAAAFCLHARRHRHAGRVVRRLRGAHEAGPGQDLLRDRRHVRRGEEQPASRSVPQEGHRGAAAGGARRRMGGRQSARIRRQAAAVGRQGRTRSGQARRRSREEGAGKRVRRAQGTGRENPESAGRAREGSARDAAADRFARRAWSPTSTISAPISSAC